MHLSIDCERAETLKNVCVVVFWVTTLDSLVTISLLMWCHNPADQNTNVHCLMLCLWQHIRRKSCISIASHVFWKLI